MTPQEAIQFLKETVAGCHILRDRQLKAVCEVSINTLEKQIPKKPNLAYHAGKFVNYHCACCGEAQGKKANKRWQKHCPHCGQALDWSDTE